MPLHFTTAGTAPWKLGLIPVLAAVLFKVTRTQPDQVDPAETVTAVEVPAAASMPSLQKPTVLPELSLADALRFDPFASLPVSQRRVDEPALVIEQPPVEVVVTPETPLAPPVDRLKERAATLQQLKVSAVFPSATGAMAIIDSKTVRVGDLLSPGVRIVEIRGTDVILSVEDGETGPGVSSGEPATR